MVARSTTSAVIVSPAGPISPLDLQRGVARLRVAGWSISVPPQIDAQHFVFAGDDAFRARQFWTAAWDDLSAVVWCARGGYGAARILPELERLTLADGTPPNKLLAGFSDVTALHEFVRSRWGWSTLHCHMPGTESFATMEQGMFARTLQLAGGKLPDPPPWALPLRSMGPEPLIDLAGTLVGGNLTVLASLAGTGFAIDNSGGRLLFLEDVGEAPYRLDRCLNQLLQAGVFRGVRAIVLGTFADCHDSPPLSNGRPVRPKLEDAAWLGHLFGGFSKATRIPVLETLPVGHGPEKEPLPLGARYKLTGEGRLELVKWDWIS